MMEDPMLLIVQNSRFKLLLPQLLSHQLQSFDEF